MHLSPGETLEVDLKFQQSPGRNVASWSFGALCTVGMLAGLTLSVLAISNHRSESETQNQEGEDRALKAGLLLGGDAVGLFVVRHLKHSDPTAKLERSHE
ncbi:MAG: hypothetical protein GY811_04465 [Myxococcales bacterium]|nr:hypothetical protein [Myxococcales bacterium]